MKNIFQVDKFLFPWWNVGIDLDNEMPYLKVPKPILQKIYKYSRKKKLTQYRTELLILFCCYLANSHLRREQFFDKLFIKMNNSVRKKKKKIKRYLSYTDKDYVPIHSYFFEEYFYTNGHKKTLIIPLEELKLIRINNSYANGFQSKSYRLNKSWYESEDIIRYNLKDNRIIDRLINLNDALVKMNFKSSPNVHKAIRENLYEFLIDCKKLQTSSIKLDDKTKNQIEKINNKKYEGNFRWWRFYSPFTNLKKEIRHYIYCHKFPNEKLWEIDITNSQLCFLLEYIRLSDFDYLSIKKYYTSSNDFKKFKEDVLAGKFYDKIAHKLSISREETKKGVFTMLFNSDWLDDYNCLPTEISKFSKSKKLQIDVANYMNENYAKVAGFLRDKKSNETLNLFPMKLSRMESNFWIFKVSRKLEDIPFITIHDSFIIPESFKEKVKDIIQSTAQDEFGFNLPLKENIL